MYLTLCIPLTWSTSRVVPAVTLGNIGYLIPKVCLLFPHQPCNVSVFANTLHEESVEQLWHHFCVQT